MEKSGACNDGTCSPLEDTKIGLLYVSDYGYAASPTSWKINNLYNYDNATILASNWLFRTTNSSHEWTISNAANYSTRAYRINASGVIGRDSTSNAYTIRPVMYLNSSVMYVSGDGKGNNPYIIE